MTRRRLAASVPVYFDEIEGYAAVGLVRPIEPTVVTFDQVLTLGRTDEDLARWISPLDRGRAGP